MKPAITSRSNGTYKLLKSLETKKGRDKSGLFFVEGKRITQEALAYARDRVRALVVSEEFNGDPNGSGSFDGPVYRFSPPLFQDVCGTVTPQGIGALLQQPPSSPIPEDSRFVLVLDRISEPGNMGTMIRTAEAAGVELICLVKGSADIYNPKAVRSTMGSIFRMKFCAFEGPDEVRRLKDAGFQLIAAALNGSEPVGDIRLPERRALIIGSEAFGVSPELLALADLKIRLPMCGRVESLNAAVAAGIIMYQLKG